MSIPSLPDHLLLLTTGRVLTLTVLLGGVAAVCSAGDLPGDAVSPEGCVTCHEARADGFSPAHRFAAQACTLCHKGNAKGRDADEAHRGLVAYPGDLANASYTCGQCHAQHVAAVIAGPMHTGRGMVNVTREVLGEQATPQGDGHLARLGDSPADSLLRKLCASCHLGQPKTRHVLDPVRDRGGGCLACHVNAYPAHGHVALTARVRDERCFGCHSRSSRISLSYAGLAEVDDDVLEGVRAGRTGRLADGRLVERRPRDAHHRAGMACIDCHTGTGLMGGVRQGGGIDIQCLDCHDNRNPRMSVQDVSAAAGRQWMPFSPASGQEFLTTARSGVPLWHVAVEPDGLYLHPKLGGRPIRIPELSDPAHRDQAHSRLSCDACHAQWAPQCHGCHVRFDPAVPQWDHVRRERSMGRWVQTRWLVRNDLPPLGITRDERIAPFVPGMIMTGEHPDWSALLFRRLFGPLSPHTTGASRTCTSCHNSPVAVGLGAGKLTRGSDGWTHASKHALLQDGLPADAWTSLSRDRPGQGPRSGERSFTRAEILRILDASPEL